MNNTPENSAPAPGHRSVGEIIDEIVAAYNRNDATAFAARFSQTAVTYEHPGKVAQVGQDGIERFYTERFAALTGQRTEVLHRVILGEYVIDHEQITRPDQSTFETVAVNHLVNGEIDRLDIIRSQSSRPKSGGSSELDSVRKPLQQYIRGHSTRDPDVMRAAFRPTAHIEGMRNGGFVSWTVDEYCTIMTGVPAPDESSRIRTIDSIDVSGNVATARMTLHHGAVTFTDMFVLIEEAGTWLIANKVYHQHP